MDFNPYAAPESEQPPAVKDETTDYVLDPSSLPRFRSARLRGLITICVTGIMLIGFAASALAFYSQSQLFVRAMAGEALSQEEANANDVWVEGAQRIRMLAYYGLLVALMFWVHRANKNLRSFGAERLDYTPGWAVGWYFVPFMNLVRPYQVVREIWLASNPESVGDRPWRWRKGPTNKLILIGWVATILWLASNALGQTIYNVALMERDSAQRLSHLHEVSLMQVGLNLAGIVPFAILCVIIWTTDNRQRAAHEKVRSVLEGEI